METPQGDTKIDSKASLDFEKNSVKIAEILSIYENGIESIFESSKRKKKTIYFCYLIARILSIRSIPA